MRFQSSDGSSFIQIERRDEDGHAVFSIVASIEGFTGSNEGVLLTGCTEFLRQLRTVDAKREGVATLQGTENCSLSIAVFDNAGHMRVDLRLCRYSYQPGPRAAALTLEGGFDFDVEFANSLFRDLHALLRNCS
jgi:hypothetical protein